ncbi:SAM-dependent methyltransferase [Legionella clemsonensis]|uniref:Methyltransferase domain protein n=1 Tax=Legionella clemsonensis TaxID=1867846 RepID=A0A222P6A5_9GAMM|nr:class I SAM-dependent methyltransferase [Legionella clemsonensis]ASQ47362.1 Methyltransferase domain protein [Legionella clemsonensis]
MSTQDNQHLISHAQDKKSLELCVNNIAAHLKKDIESSEVLGQYLDLLHQLQQFDFGRFLIQNQGINGYWTHYITTHPFHGRKTGKNNREEPFSPLEIFLLDKAPIIVATQERFEIFLRENQKAVREGATLACIPCGTMSELLYLQLQQSKNIRLLGFDYDRDTFADAHKLAEKLKISHPLELHHADAWHLGIQEEFDLISSNGLTIYEPDEERVLALFEGFYQALKPGGKLVTSFLTPPPVLTEQCEWDMSSINSHDLQLQRTLFVDILKVKFQCYRSTEQTRKQLKVAGFINMEFFYDRAKLFPTVVAYKK